jgi:hypothetical protein
MRISPAKALAYAALMVAPAKLMAAPAKDAAIVIVADSRNVSGMRAWWMNVYNDSHLLFAILTIVILPVTALFLGKCTSWGMTRLGIDLKSRKLAEH